MDKERPGKIKSFSQVVAEHKQRVLDEKTGVKKVKFYFFHEITQRYFREDNVKIDPVLMEISLIKYINLYSDYLRQYSRFIKVQDVHEFAETKFKQYLIDVGYIDKDAENLYNWKSCSYLDPDYCFIGLKAIEKGKCNEI